MGRQKKRRSGAGGGGAGGGRRKAVKPAAQINAVPHLYPSHNSEIVTRLRSVFSTFTEKNSERVKSSVKPAALEVPMEEVSVLLCFALKGLYGEPLAQVSETVQAIHCQTCIKAGLQCIHRLQRQKLTLPGLVASKVSVKLERDHTILWLTDQVRELIFTTDLKVPALADMIGV